MMKIVQTFYNFQKENPINNAAGFLAPEFNWMSMALSCHLLKKHFGHVSLFCNESAKEIIIDRLNIPYDEVCIIPDFMDKYSHTNLWALPKIYTYSQQTEPFLHVDCDWFMFEKLSDNILSADLIGQNIEYDDQLFNRNAINELLDAGVHFPEIIQREINKPEILNVVNAGILGGKDLAFFESYLSVIKIFLYENFTILDKLADGRINSIYEQLFFYILANNENKEIKYCTP